MGHILYKSLHGFLSKQIDSALYKGNLTGNRELWTSRLNLKIL